jgi:hypothetical protein
VITFSKDGKSITLPTPDSIEDKRIHRIQAKEKTGKNKVEWFIKSDFPNH